GRPVGEVISMETLPRLYRDQSLDTAMKNLGTHPFLPVSSRRRPFRLIGTVSLEDIHRAYGVPECDGPSPEAIPESFADFPEIRPSPNPG
ncbi:MAG TPA: hypothetical protein VHB50_02290, partial [Bryobacteraceae bacterium]|nr:hypothetical protein [Bryobacteraceae bacterium]